MNLTTFAYRSFCYFFMGERHWGGGGAGEVVGGGVHVRDGQQSKK
jgi:hypothetical protein